MIQFATVAPSRRTYSHFDFFRAQADSSLAPNRRARKESDYWFYKTMKAFNHSTIVVLFPRYIFSIVNVLYFCLSWTKHRIGAQKKKKARADYMGLEIIQVVGELWLYEHYSVYIELGMKTGRGIAATTGNLWKWKIFEKGTGQKKENAMEIILKFVRLFCGGFE